MNRFESSGSPTIAGDRSTFGFCWRMRSRKGVPLSPHQVSLQSRLLEEPFPVPSVEIAETFDEDEGELTFGLDV